MPSAVAIAPVAEARLICPQEGADVQAAIRALRQHAAARDTLSEGSASLGRAHWVGSCPSQELAADGVRMPVALWWARCGSCLAIYPGHDHSVGSGSGPSRAGPGGRAGEPFLSADRSANRIPPRALYRR